MTARLAAGMLVSALIRRVEAAGGHAAVIARGDATAGALIVKLAERGVAGPLLERALDPAGRYVWQPTGPDEEDARADYLARRRRSDPDLWVIELDVAGAGDLLREVVG